MIESEIPSSGIGFERISAAATLKIELVELRGDANVTLELRSLNGRTIVVEVSDAHHHKLYVLDVLIEVFHDIIEALSNSNGGIPHRAGNVERKDYRLGVWVVLGVATLTNLVLWIKLVRKLTRGEHLLSGVVT